MKLNELLKESDGPAWNTPANRKWFQDHVTVTDGGDGPAVIKEIDGDRVFDLLVNNNEGQDPLPYWMIFFEFDGQPVTKCPIPDDEWGIILDIDSSNGIVYKDCVVNDPSLLCLVEHDSTQLKFKRATINSLKFPANAPLSQITFGKDNTLNCGLLSLLKITKLKYLVGNWSSDLGKALEIVRDHLRADRDVAECMDDLIEAGLKEYAKA